MKNESIRIAIHLITGYGIGALLTIVSAGKETTFLESILIIVGLFTSFFLAVIIFLALHRRQEKKEKLSEWEDAIILAQVREPRINNRMYHVLKEEAIRSFLEQDQEKLDVTVRKELVCQKARFILDVWQDLYPLEEERKESEE